MVAASLSAGGQVLAREGHSPDQNGGATNPDKEVVNVPSDLPPPPFVTTGVRTGSEAERRVAWWRDAKVGMFIHFGLYAIPGKGEWVMWNRHIPRDEYSKLASQFKPDPAAPYPRACSLESHRPKCSACRKP